MDLVIAAVVLNIHGVTPGDGIDPIYSVMAGLVPAIHVFTSSQGRRTWMPGTRPGMTNMDGNRCLFARHCHGKRRQFKAKTLRISANAARPRA
jgi:hypothetical protein